MGRQGKDGLALKAARGEAVAADLARQCPLLTPQQLYRLTEHYDNDWAVGERAAALTVLRRFVARIHAARVEIAAQDLIDRMHAAGGAIAAQPVDDRVDAAVSRAPACSWC